MTTGMWKMHFNGSSSVLQGRSVRENRDVKVIFGRTRKREHGGAWWETGGLSNASTDVGEKGGTRYVPETGLSTQLLIVQRETAFSRPFAHSHARFALLTDLSWRTLAKGLSFWTLLLCQKYYSVMALHH